MAGESVAGLAGVRSPRGVSPGTAISQRAHITWRRNAVVIPLARLDKATSRAFYIPESQPPIYGRELAYREPEGQPDIYGRPTRPPARKRHGS